MHNLNIFLPNKELNPCILSHVVYTVLDKELRFIEVSTNFLNILGLKKEDFQYQYIQDFCRLSTEQLSTLLHTENNIELTFNNDIKQEISFAATIIRAEDRFLLLKKVLPYDNSIDPLTKLFSFTKLYSDINLIDENHIMAIIDIESFVTINELHGKLFGNKTLQTLALKLSEVFNDFTVYKLHTVRFSILKRLDCDSENYDDEVESIKYGLNKIFSKVFKLENEEISISAIAGISIFNDREILSIANEALHQAKLKNKKSYYLKDREESKKLTHHNNLILTMIMKAFENEGFELYLQPIICNKTMTIAKYETLIRLKCEQGNILSPGSFLELTKKNKMYNKLTRKIIHQSFTFFKSFNQSFSINITLEDIANEKTYDLIFVMLNNFPYPQNVTFEIVESDNIDDTQLFNRFSRKVQSLGASISIDDFGSGYSSLAYLTNIDFNYLKFDGSLIRDIEIEKNYNLIKGIVDWTKEHNIKTVAEYVENKEILEKIISLGIDYSQGYYFSKPLPINEVEQFQQGFNTCTKN